MAMHANTKQSVRKLHLFRDKLLSSHSPQQISFRSTTRPSGRFKAAALVMTKKSVKQVYATKQRKDKIKESKIKEVTQSAVQTTIEKINDRLLKASLGYTMTDVMSENNFGKGPKMIAQTINIRGINDSFLKEFGLQVQCQGLHNKDMHNAITIGINKKYYLCAKMELGQPQTEEMNASLKKAEEVALKEVQIHGKLLVHFINQGK
ncbi:hypothetical protein DFJ58DRAFT_844350 [Suillus subalutaceus]|uniref:uncharacterized protein n=1 Tax=Suillus subalutaceus TaxID=48586 RepID=UPI001B872AF1|nr:uncharacterized protein DFJ58DRAFT_844350 [Suillus subalutaceus]KAG1843356.1 hypothetical protein DFJ58DRAFT_844350 [Suillus subalutaceus]